jgi:hypothetical protein
MSKVIQPLLKRPPLILYKIGCFVLQGKEVNIEEPFKILSIVISAAE